MRLSGEQKRLLRALADGQFLKAHRYLDGSKVFLLHPLEGPPQVIQGEIVAVLENLRLIDSNKKFPAATYLLTGEGRAAAALARQGE